MPDDLKPLSPRTRRAYLALFIFLFIVCLPLAILYATGYRFQSGLSLVETGGVYISVGVSDATVSLNGKDIGTSGFLNHSFYLDNLAPGTYAVHVSREGNYPWYKTLVVEPRIVTDVQAFMVPSELSVKRITVGPVTIAQASTTSLITRAQYDIFLKAFAPTTTRQIIGPAKEPLPEDTQGGEALFLDKGAVRLTWTRSTSTIPSSLCIAPSRCEKSVIITHSKEAIARTNFYAGGVLYQAQSGIYLTEADVRPTPLTVPIYQKPGAEYRFVGGQLIVKDGSTLYLITGL
jgi:hypothetical protein